MKGGCLIYSIVMGLLVISFTISQKYGGYIFISIIAAIVLIVLIDDNGFWSGIERFVQGTIMFSLFLGYIFLMMWIFWPIGVAVASVDENPITNVFFYLYALMILAGPPMFISWIFNQFKKLYKLFSKKS